MKSVTTVARYFKEIQFSICQSYPSFIFLNEYFSQMWEEFGTSEFFLLSFDIRFNVPKCDVDVWASRSPPTKERSLVCNLYENVSMCERFKCIKNFKIEMYDNFYEVDDFDAEMLSIKEKLLKMENLTTFEIDLSVIMEPYNFPIYYGGLNRNLKNMRLCNCYSLELYSLIEIGHRCTKIENISLTEVRSNEITIKSIMSLFKNLKGLYIQFTSNYCFDNIINDLARKDEVKGNYLLDWPDIDFLKICFNEPDNKGVELLNAVEKNTPRRSGRFLIKQKTSDENKTLWEIIIQRNTNYITEFNDIFKTHYVF